METETNWKEFLKMFGLDYGDILKVKSSKLEDGNIKTVETIYEIVDNYKWMFRDIEKGTYHTFAVLLGKEVEKIER